MNKNFRKSNFIKNKQNMKIKFYFFIKILKKLINFIRNLNQKKIFIKRFYIN